MLFSLLTLPTQRRLQPVCCQPTRTGPPARKEKVIAQFANPNVVPCSRAEERQTLLRSYTGFSRARGTVSPISNRLIPDNPTATTRPSCPAAAAPARQFATWKLAIGTCPRSGHQQSTHPTINSSVPLIGGVHPPRGGFLPFQGGVLPRFTPSQIIKTPPLTASDRVKPHQNFFLRCFRIALSGLLIPQPTSLNSQPSVPPHHQLAFFPPIAT